MNFTIIRSRRFYISFNVRELWHYRELIYFLAWRDIKVRYKQTALGILWIVFQPITTTAIFTLIFGRFAKLDSDTIPYALFVYTGLLSWNFFSSSLLRSSNSLIGNVNLITKVYFPRMVIPMASILSGLIDFLVSLPVLAAFMLFYKITPTPLLFYVPIFIFFAMVAALGAGLWLSTLYAKYRDINFIAPFLIQTWMYLTPVIYSTNFLPDPFRKWLCLNPMTSVVEGFRWSLFGHSGIDPTFMILSAAMTCFVLISGIIYFHHVEKTLADYI